MDKLVSDIEDAIEGLQKLSNMAVFQLPENDEQLLRIGAAENTLQRSLEALKANEWVSVEERLPEPNRQVLVRMPDDDPFADEPFYLEVDRHDGDDWGLVLSEEITHWKPIGTGE